MAKKLLFSCLVWALSLGTNLIFAYTAPSPLEKSITPNADLCDAPPPDSFRIANISTNGVNLTWIPAWVGATHTIEVYLEVGQGNWNILTTFYNIPGSAYTIPGLAPGSYKITNATNCGNGEISFKFTELKFKQIELVLAGRVPINPIPVDACGEGLNMNNYHWVGFSVSKTGTAISTIFEVTLDGKVKRIGHNSQIVAVNEDGAFPVPGDPSKIADSPFLLKDLDPSEPVDIGYVKFWRPNWTQPFIKLCKDESQGVAVPWKPKYIFTALTASSSSTVGYSTGFSIDPTQGNSSELIPEYIKVENPLRDKINVFFPQKFINSGQVKLHLLNANGQLISAYKFDIQNNQISFPVEWLSPGIYFLKVHTGIETITLKIVKPE